MSCLALAACLATLAASRPAQAEANLVIEADTGKVLFAENATIPWYPASVTKLMTAYVVLKAVKDGRTSLDNLVSVSPIAAGQAPSKMGFRAGTQLTIDNAMKMMLVKSANDMAVVLAEGLDGSIEAFADEMNQTALRLGMTQTHFVNPNGLPADGHVSSARDLALLARALLRDLPEYEYFVHIPAIKFGRRITRNFNSLIGRYPGADGMKTGFICASGFNLVASATRNNKRLIAVVLGASSSSMRTYKAAQLLERGFSGSGLAWLTPSLGTVDSLQPVNVDPPNLRDDMCGPHRKRQQAPESDDDNAVSATSENTVSMFAGLQPGQMKPAELLAAAPAAAEPVIVYTGPKRTGAAIIAANAADAAAETPPKAKGKRGKGRARAAAPQTAAAKPDAKTDAKIDAKTDAKPARAASAKPAVERPPAAVRATSAPAAGDKARAAAQSESSRTDKKAEKKPDPKRSEAQKPAGKKDAKPVSQRTTDPAPRS
ncbi:D-alanyl-D-alanine carboxypeptidase [Bradyrhizobium sp. U87765 SZCCT0131]|uniref:D-alanyl-D-alanine carboxypeptidase family protein n=1 Tax=unclassified Bradyrhizobium TaxID=2631580 RepID=UPI001BA81B1C|nr:MULTISPECIES: D-alanyl-D-alanine carboxypeptidase family protein [unclassified Bradyrhizobium]MBR1222042.1 D-alanyl-D-alanine carboxypeptidase [Bradyrhizobium sp. U87765 SZCCT0131]MBR1263760.1 D-alanyl-D-alanine carboxypeptidase [Bradyrhizobium sp. U87765 SZCCT0134]MBR1302670.1 D-alanyl-D-alanine carboxypeptidase [Bradyrhizobium sp. U87765 SZCCT0110]MBR1320010.1 D-alanyl-D-alanine carboxypeptidase [Bradyrhizobium sp. U87765 SZCCT0109]MBR1348877.1 D-alanyl-D-alanine carboxypeptidase [Bradyrh